MAAALALTDVARRAPAACRKLASGVSTSSSEIASALLAVQPANDTGEMSSCACDFTAESLIWLSNDPAGLLGGLNLYGYTNNNPVNYIDSDGRWVVPVLVAVGFVCGFVLKA